MFSVNILYFAMTCISARETEMKRVLNVSFVGMGVGPVWGYEDDELF